MQHMFIRYSLKLDFIIFQRSNTLNKEDIPQMSEKHLYRETIQRYKTYLHISISKEINFAIENWYISRSIITHIFHVYLRIAGLQDSFYKYGKQLQIQPAIYTSVALQHAIGNGPD